MDNTLSFELPDCLLTEEARADFSRQIKMSIGAGEMPTLCLTISPRTTDKDVYQAIQVISAINRFLEVRFQLVDETDTVISNPEGHPARGYLEICQSWLPNSHVVM